MKKCCRAASQPGPGCGDFFVRPGAGSRPYQLFMPADKNFTFICGADDFLVGRLGQAALRCALAAGVADGQVFRTRC